MNKCKIEATNGTGLSNQETTIVLKENDDYKYMVIAEEDFTKQKWVK